MSVPECLCYTLNSFQSLGTPLAGPLRRYVQKELQQECALNIPPWRGTLAPGKCYIHCPRGTCLSAELVELGAPLNSSISQFLKGFREILNWPTMLSRGIRLSDSYYAWCSNTRQALNVANQIFKYDDKYLNTILDLLNLSLRSYMRYIYNIYVVICGAE